MRARFYVILLLVHANSVWISPPDKPAHGPNLNRTLQVSAYKLAATSIRFYGTDGGEACPDLILNLEITEPEITEVDHSKIIPFHRYSLDQCEWRVRSRLSFRDTNPP